MDVHEQLRQARLLREKALDEAGFYPTAVSFDLLMSQSGERGYAGQAGDRLYWRLLVKPTPQVIFKRQVDLTVDGFIGAGDVTLKGAFPILLTGQAIFRDNSGTESSGTTVSKQYATTQAFRQDLETADRFLLDGLPYQFVGGGQLEMDAFQSEWTLRLVRVD
jgi:hypothetical protein